MRKSDFWMYTTRHMAKFTFNTPSNEWWRFTQTPQIYYLTNAQKRSRDVILGKSGRYCSAYKLQDKTEYWLIKLHWFVVFRNSILRLELCVGDYSHKSPQWRLDWIWAPCVARPYTCGYLSDKDNPIFWLNTYKNLGNLVMQLTGFVCTTTRNHRQTLREIFEKR